MGRFHATCCQDDGFLSGCPVGYDCVPGGGCLETNRRKPKDPTVQYLPRYRLCHPEPMETLERVHGFPVDGKDPKATKDNNNNNNNSTPRLAYYSSHGDITKPWFFNNHNHNQIDAVLMVVHGSNRNADDYYCAATAAVSLQTIHQNVLVLAPWFLSVEDGPVHLEGGGQPLRWAIGDGDGPWRYGDDSVQPIVMSSFTALDHMMRHLLNTLGNGSGKVPPPLVLAGHSSGGQLVQRYALLTHVWDNQRMHAVVANPSSYAYLTPLRYDDNQGGWTRPTRKDCPGYNQWEYGLEIENQKEGDNYVWRHAFPNNTTTTTNALVERFGHRRVTYLIGGADVCNMTNPPPSPQQQHGWCDSHGLETTCSDEWQGPNRWERNRRYYESLSLLNQTFFSHERVQVDFVGHDHSLMFTQPAGLRVLFSPFTEAQPWQQE